MSREDTLRTWAQRPSDSEQARIERTERMVREALGHSTDSRVQNAYVFAKGSVKNNTNIRADSDIDICVRASGVFYPEYPGNTSGATFGNQSVDYTFTTFRRGVEEALVEYFGLADVDTAGSKAIRVRASASGSRIDADVVPAFEHRRYINSSTAAYYEGIEIRPKGGGASVINWPGQNYGNGVTKHSDTYRRYKKMVRIIKRMRSAMRDIGVESAHNAQSFLIESLLWNVPDDHYGFDSLEEDLTNIFSYLKSQLVSTSLVTEWGEVNELKYLFRPQQKWTRASAEAFVKDASDYFGGMR